MPPGNRRIDQAFRRSNRAVCDRRTVSPFSLLTSGFDSRLCGELDERVNALLGRQIEGDSPCLWIDATYVKTREVGRMAVIVAVGVNTDDCTAGSRKKAGAMTMDASLFPEGFGSTTSQSPDITPDLGSQSLNS